MSRHRRSDVVVVGGGPAGLAAASTAADAGKRVLLLDQGLRLGGQIWRHRAGEALPRVAREALTDAAAPGISVAHRATVVDAISANELVVSFKGRLARVETDALVLATGAVERFLPFPGWTLPGVVGVGGLQALVKAGLRVVGARVVIAGSGPLMLPVAATLARHGAEVVLIAEQSAGHAVRRFARRALLSPARAMQALALRSASRSAPYRTDAWVVRATGREQVEEVVLQVAGREHRYACDWLATNAGLVPRTDLAELLGCRVGPDGILVDQQQRTSVVSVYAAGECCGVKGDRGAAAEGAIAGLAAAGGLVPPARLRREAERERRFGTLLRDCFAPRRELAERITDDTIICRCENVGRGAIDPDWSQRQAKLWTRIGMGSCQGAVCGPACQTLFGWQRNAPRPPLEPVSAAAWAAVIAPAVATPTAHQPPAADG